jgi:mannose-1-phosphate guanylyltransferase
VVGDERPKQFCPVLGAETLMERTRRRVALAIPPARTLVVLTRSHEHFYRPLVGGIPAHCVVVEPEARGTAAAIFYGAVRIARYAPTAVVAIVPSDHYVSDDHAFMGHVAIALDTVQARTNLVALLGITPTRAETEYGWIEPGAPIPGTELFQVTRFHEKPDASVAAVLRARRNLWNSFVVVARVSTLLTLVQEMRAPLAAAFAPLRAALGTLREATAARIAYRDMTRVDFSTDVLARCPAKLAVLPVNGVQWCDLGNPERVMATLGGLGIRPEWANRMAVPA